MGPLSLGSEPWIDFVHAAEVMVDLDYTADTPNVIEEFAWNYVTQHKNVQPALQTAYEFGKAVKATRTAVSMGVALAASDGPLPFGDVLGFAVASAGTIYAWYDFFS